MGLIIRITRTGANLMMMLGLPVMAYTWHRPESLFLLVIEPYLIYRFIKQYNRVEAIADMMNCGCLVIAAAILGVVMLVLGD